MGKKGKANKKKGNTKTATAAAGDENIAVTSKKALFEEPKKASPTTLKESVMQNTAAEEKKKEAPKTEAKEEIKAEETQTELKEEPQTERKEDGHSSIDDWFAKQRRQLVTITEQPKAAAQGAADRRKLTDGLDSSSQLTDASFVHDVNASTSFDLWLERQKKELSTMVGTVETLASPVKMEDWEATLAKKSSDSLEKWKASLVDEPVSKTKVSIEVDQTHKEAVQELERSLEKMATASTNHLDRIQANEQSLEVSHIEKMMNLQFSMEDRLYGTKYEE